MIITTPKWFSTGSWATPRWKTAISRPTLSSPMQEALSESVIYPDSKVLDFGCGRHLDVNRLNKIQKIDAKGFDPYYYPDDSVVVPTEVVSLIYVLNVIEDAKEREEVLKFCWSITLRVLIVAVRTTYGKGEEVITKTGTFQKYFQQAEFASWITQQLGENIVEYPKNGIAFIFK